MGKFKVITHSIILTTTPSFLVYPQGSVPQADFHVQTVHSRKLQKNFRKKERYHLVSYDDMLNLFEEIESGKAEKKYREKDITRINDYLAYLAEKGLLPNSDNALALREDIEDLLYGDNDEYVFAVGDEYSIIPAVYYDHANIFFCKSRLSKKWKKTKNFIRKHKKEIIIGAVIVVATAAVVVVVVAASSAGAAAAAGAAGAAASQKSKHPQSNKAEKKQEISSFSCDPVEIDLSETPIFEDELENQISCFKEKLANEEFFQPANSTAEHEELSWEETGRVLGPLFAHESVSEFQSRLPNDPQLAQEIQTVRLENHLPTEVEGIQYDFGHQEIDLAFSTDYSSLFAESGTVTDFIALSYQMRGRQASAFGYYEQAVNDLGKAIELEPAQPLLYLDRSVNYFRLGEYDRSLEDFHQYTSQTPEIHSLSIPEFSMGFAKGLPKGIYESGEGILFLFSDLVMHPIHTGEQMWEALTILSNLARSEEWGILGKALAPEVHRLVTQWDTIPSNERGELAGYAFGKYGADILIPGAIAKATSRGMKGIKELSTVYKSFQTAEKTLLLESVAELENSGAIRGLIQAKIVARAEELGFTAREIAPLKNIGKIEGQIKANTPNISRKIHFTEHALQRAIERSVSKEFILDALDTPLKIEAIKIDQLGRPSQRFIGKKAEVVINPETQQIVSVNPTSTKKANKLIDGLSDVKDSIK